MKKVIALLLAVAMVFCLAACTDGATDTTGTTTTTADNTSKTPATKVIDIDLTEEEYAFGVDKDQPELLTAVNSFIAEIKENGKFEEICNKYFGDGTPTPVTSAEIDDSKDQLVVATNAAFEPFEYTDGDKYLGIDMEIAALLAEKLGKELVIMNIDFDAVCLSVGQHKADIAMAGLTIKEDRKEHVNFSDSYYTASQRLIVKGDDTTFDICQTAADVEAILNTFISDVKVGVQNGTTGKFYCEGDEDWGFTGFQFETKGYKNGSLAVQDMINGNIHYVIIDSAPAAFITAALNEMA